MSSGFNGLTSHEFLQRWEAMPHIKHAELIDGIFYLPSRVDDRHSTLHFKLSGWLAVYAASTPGCEGGAEGTWIMGERDVPQPDIALRIAQESGGQSHIEGEYPAGAPELIVEVAASSRACDLGVKLKLYERMGVREYVIALAGKEQILWKELVAGSFQPLSAGADRIFRSRCFPGLWLDATALWRRDQTRVFSALQQGLTTPEHAAFVTRLTRR